MNDSNNLIAELTQRIEEAALYELTYIIISTLITILIWFFIIRKLPLVPWGEQNIMIFKKELKKRYLYIEWALMPLIVFVINNLIVFFMTRNMGEFISGANIGLLKIYTKFLMPINNIYTPYLSVSLSTITTFYLAELIIKKFMKNYYQDRLT